MNFSRWLAGDSTAAKVLVRRHEPGLAAFFRNKGDAEDIQDLTQQVWAELPRVRPGSIVVSFRAYLFGIARNLLYHHYERKARLAWDPLTTSILEVDPALAVDPSQVDGGNDMTIVLQRLPLEVQLLLELRYVQEMTTAELAAIYSVPSGTVKSRLSSARTQLKRALMRHQLHGTARPALVSPPKD